MSRRADVSNPAGLLRLIRREQLREADPGEPSVLRDVRSGVPPATAFRRVGVRREDTEAWLRDGAELAKHGENGPARDLWEVVDVAEAEWERSTIREIQEQIAINKAPAAKVLLEMLQRRFPHWAPQRVEVDDVVSWEAEMARIQRRRDGAAG